MVGRPSPANQWKNYTAILFIWLLAYFLPVLAMEHTDWYPTHFHVFQSIVPCFLIFTVYHLSPLSHHWSESLGYIYILQIIHNLGDVLFDDSWQAYDLRQAVLNGMELALLIGWGLPALIYQTLKAHRMSRDSRLPHNSSDSRRRLAKDAEGLSGHAR